jgi:hypothetical protein
MELDYKLASIPVLTGGSPQHWHQAMNAWILKKPNEFRVSKMRTILLYDAMFNQNNKWIGRSAMRHAEELQQNISSPALQPLAPEQFGSRKAHHPMDQCLNKRLTFDLSRQLHRPMALCSNDAKSCYDRVVHSIASLCLQRIGCSKPAATSMFETLQHLRHHVRTQYGDSLWYYEAKQDGLPIQGLGQGNGAGPTIWALISTPVLNMLRSHGYGIKIVSCISRDYLHFVGYCFVDDTDLVAFPDHVTSAKEVAASMQEAVDAWEAGIRATGGAIVPEKSHWYLIDYRWQNGSWRYATTKENPFDLSVLDEEQRRHKLRRLEVKDAERTLGARLAPSGCCRKEKAFLRDCATAWAEELRTGRLPRRLSWQALTGTILRKLIFPLPVTTFSRKDCDYIIAPVLRVALSMSGIVNTIPRALVYAPLQYQGLNLPDLYVEQGLGKVLRLIKYGNRSSHITSSLIRHSCEALKMELGLNGPLFQHSPTVWHDVVTPSWVRFTWKFLHHYDICVRDDLPDFPMMRENDTLLMANFGRMLFPAMVLAKINRCRIFLQAVTIADITDGSGNKITEEAWHGKPSINLTPHLQWGWQPRPPESFWAAWRQALSKLCARHCELRTPLGRWTDAGQRRVIWWFDQASEALFQSGPTSFTFPSRSIRRTRTATFRFLASSKTSSSIPPSATPCTVSTQGAFLLYQGQASTVCLVGDNHPTFFSYVQSLHSKAWIFDNIQTSGSLAALADSIRSGSCTCITDGSCKDDHGTAAWKIVDLSNPHNILEGQCVTPGTLAQQCAYRSELSGLYAVVAATNAMIQYFDIEDRSVVIACDNAGAIRSTSYTTGGTNPASCKHFDLVMAIQRMKSRKIRWNHTHVDGHMDDIVGHVLSPLEILNTEMDTKAKAFWSRTHNMTGPRMQYFDDEPWTVTIGNEKIVTDFAYNFHDWCQRPRIQSFWMEKSRLPMSELDHVDYSTAGYALKQTSLRERREVTKHTSGYCAVNKWMFRWKKRQSSQCPRCDELVEDSTHVWHCKGHESTKRWEDHLQALQQSLVALNTDPILARIIIERLTTWQSGEQPATLSWIPENYRALLAHQDAQGWDNFFMGLPSLGWTTLQHLYLQRINSKQTGKRWLTAIIRKQWMIAWDIWNYQNGFVHDATTGVEIAQVQQSIREEYQKGAPTRDTARYFRLSLSRRLKTSFDHQTAWLYRIQQARNRTQRDRSMNSMRAAMAAFVRPQPPTTS